MNQNSGIADLHLSATGRWFVQNFDDVLLNNQESALHLVIGDAIPHHTRFPSSNGMLERDHLPGVQRRILMHGAKSALAVVQQAADDFLRRGIVERKSEGTLAAITALCSAIGG
jgi:hypothetical protein